MLRTLRIDGYSQWLSKGRRSLPDTSSLRQARCSARCASRRRRPPPPAAAAMARRRPPRRRRGAPSEASRDDDVARETDLVSQPRRSRRRGARSAGCGLLTRRSLHRGGVTGDRHPATVTRARIIAASRLLRVQRPHADVAARARAKRARRRRGRRRRRAAAREHVVRRRRL